MAGRSYFEVLTEAIDTIAREGYQSPEQIDYWTDQIRRAAERSLRSETEIEAAVRDALGAIYRKNVEMGGILQRMSGVSAYTLERMKPELHAELGRRIAASLDLIKLNREQSIERTKQRFRGWATSIPAGGSDTVERREEKKQIRKALASASFEERRVTIDQGHKLFNAINTTVAVNGGAIGGVWKSHKFQVGYNGRVDHNARDDHFFLVRDSWAHKAGLVKPNKNGYTDDVEQPGQLPFCRCSWKYVMSLRSVPPECLTEKGKKALAEARRKIANAA